MSRQRRNFSAKFKSDLVMTFGYLWNAVRVQGGAYGTGMGARLNGNLFSYSYRNPNLENTRAAIVEWPISWKNLCSREYRWMI